MSIPPSLERRAQRETGKKDENMGLGEPNKKKESKERVRFEKKPRKGEDRDLHPPSSMRYGAGDPLEKNERGQLIDG